MNDILTTEELINISKQNINPRPGIIRRLGTWTLGLLFMIPFYLALAFLFYQLRLITPFSPKYYIQLYLVLSAETITATLCIALYLSKDALNGQSLSKRLLRLQIVNNTTGIVASPMQTLVRNLTYIIWPIELVMMCINPSRRLGDKIANTRLERYSTLITVTQRKYNILHTIPVFITAIVISSMGIKLFKMLLKIEIHY